MKVFFKEMHLDFRNNIAFFKVPRLRQFFLLVWSIVRMILTQRQTRPLFTLSVINLIRVGLGSNPAFRGDRICLNYIQRWVPIAQRSQTVCITKTVFLSLLLMYCNTLSKNQFVHVIRQRD